MATLTLKNIPDDLYEHLKVSAQTHHRSINGELIHYLAAPLKPNKVSAEERFARLRRSRPWIDPDVVGIDEIQKAIDHGCP